MCLLLWLLPIMGPTFFQLRFGQRRQGRNLALSPTSMMANSLLSTIDIVLSCSICQATLSSIYEEDDQNNGLRNGDDLHDGRVTKLWLTECAHLTCAKHLEGGGKSCFRISASIDRANKQASRSTIPFESANTPSTVSSLHCREERSIGKGPVLHQRRFER